MFRELMASPSFSRIVGTTTIRTGKFRSVVICRMTAVCCQSFAPNTAMFGCIRLNSLATIVVTPRKCVGRDAPSICLVKCDSTTNVLCVSSYI